MFSETLESLLGGTSLDEPSAQAFMTDVLAGNMAPERLAAALVALRAKGPSVNELVGFAKGMLHHAERIRPDGECFDNCGTGGATMKTFNVSTIAAFVIAADGVQVAKHGNRTITRPSGSADLLEQAGARLDLSPAQCQHVLDETGIAFLFAPTFHPAMRHAGPVRQALGIKTVFNLLGPLTNPAGAERRVLGVYDPRLVTPMAEALARLGCERGYVLHGLPGSDEATPCGPILAAPIDDGIVTGEVTIDPADLGVAACTPDAIAPVPREQGPDLARSILSGQETGPRQDIVALNAGLALAAAGRAGDVAAGVTRARRLLADGAGMAKWEAFIEATRSLDA